VLADLEASTSDASDDSDIALMISEKHEHFNLSGEQCISGPPRHASKPTLPEAVAMQKEQAYAALYQRNYDKLKAIQYQTQLKLFDTATLAKGNSEDDPWVLDSGCSRHMQRSTKYGIGVPEPARPGHKVGLADSKTKLVVASYQDSRFESLKNADPVHTLNAPTVACNLSLSQVLNVEGLGQNLLSVNQITDEGGSVHFYKTREIKHGIITLKSGECIPVRWNSDHLQWEVKAKPIPVMHKPETICMTARVVATNPELNSCLKSKTGDFRDKKGLVAFSDQPKLKNDIGKTPVTESGFNLINNPLKQLAKDSQLPSHTQNPM